MELTGRVALITGGSAGLGRELVHALAARGWTVVTDGRDPDRLREAIAGRKNGGGVAWGWGGIANRLARLGMRSISNVVDASNLVMLELNQPINLRRVESDSLG